MHKPPSPAGLPWRRHEDRDMLVVLSGKLLSTMRRRPRGIKKENEGDVGTIKTHVLVLVAHTKPHKSINTCWKVVGWGEWGHQRSVLQPAGQQGHSLCTIRHQDTKWTHARRSRVQKVTPLNWTFWTWCSFFLILNPKHRKWNFKKKIPKRDAYGSKLTTMIIAKSGILMFCESWSSEAPNHRRLGDSMARLSTCGSVLGQDIEPCIASNRPGSPLHGSWLPLVCGWMCEWENERL